MKDISKSRSSSSDVENLTNSLTPSKSWFSAKKSSASQQSNKPNNFMVNENREDDAFHEGSISKSQSSISFSAMKYFGFSSEPLMSIENRDDAAFDAFMDDNECSQHLDKCNNVTITTKNPLLSQKKDASAISTALACIADKNYKKFLSIVKNNPSILSCKTKKTHLKLKGCNGGTLLHVIVSQQPKIKKKKQKNQNKQKEQNNGTFTDIQVYPSVPEVVLRFVIKTCPQALEMKDDDGRLPIHCACLSQGLYLEEILKLQRNSNDTLSPLRFNVMETNIMHFLLKCNVDCAKVPDRKGNLAIHYAATMVAHCICGDTSSSHKWNKSSIPTAEDTMRRLLLAFPHSVTMKNDKGMLPIHNLANMGEMMNIKCLKLLLLGHQKLGEPPTARNEEGDPSLHVALKSGATSEGIQCFANSEHSSRLFIQRDSENNNALHIALRSNYPDAALIRTILDNAPFTASSPDSDGIMPLRAATQLRLELDLIRTLLRSDMPIEIGIDKGKSVTPLKHKLSIKDRIDSGKAILGKRHIVRRSHHHSWWFILVECNDFYMDAVYNLLAEEATHFQIVSLARQIGPDGKTILINRVSDSCRVMFHSLLRFYDRYEILLSTNELRVCCEDVVDGVQTFLALDHGGLPPIDGKAYSDAKLNVPYFTNAVKVQHEEDKDSAIELSLVPENNKKVLLRTYLYEEAFYAELKVREKFFFCPSQFEEIYNHHCRENFTHLALSKSDKLCCIAFERPCHSLVDVFASVAGSLRSQKWIEKCWVVLRQIAMALKALHDQNLVHGHLVPSNCCKFGNIWKLSQLGTVTQVASPMRGTFRSCVPPESIVVTKSNSRSQNSTQLLDKKIFIETSPPRVKFSAWALDEGKERKSSKRKNLNHASSVLLPRAIFGCNAQNAPMSDKSNNIVVKDDVNLSFHPERVVTTVAWDMWGFGLVMVQLLTGRCMHLSNFEKAEDAVMKKLHLYDDSVLQSICNQLQTTVGTDATDLVRMLLQKDPAKRPKSMDDVLKHPYFEALTIFV